MSQPTVTIEKDVSIVEAYYEEIVDAVELGHRDATIVEHHTDRCVRVEPIEEAAWSGEEIKRINESQWEIINVETGENGPVLYVERQRSAMPDLQSVGNDAPEYECI